MTDEYRAEWIVVPVPLNADGDGPETRPELVARTEWQVWTWDCILVATCADEAVARYIVDLHNGEVGE